MTTCWLYGYIISRDGFLEHVAFVDFQPDLYRRHQRGSDKYYTRVSRTTASTASFLVVEHKGKRLVTHRLAKLYHKNIFSVINMANSLQLLWLQLQRHGFIERGHLSSIALV